jgi:hypothetical protein
MCDFALRDFFFFFFRIVQVLESSGFESRNEEIKKPWSALETVNLQVLTPVTSAAPNHIIEPKRDIMHRRTELTSNIRVEAIGFSLTPGTDPQQWLVIPFHRCTLGSFHRCQYVLDHRRTG